MSNPPWMPLDVADYLRDTPHLQTEESGAYLHLIMAYWMAGGLPNDDRQLAVITKLSLTRFRRKRKILEAFFGPGFSSHKRIDRELQRAAQLREKRSGAARERWSKQDANGYARAMHMHTQLQRKKDLKED